MALFAFLFWLVVLSGRHVFPKKGVVESHYLRRFRVRDSFLNVLRVAYVKKSVFIL